MIEYLALGIAIAALVVGVRGYILAQKALGHGDANTEAIIELGQSLDSASSVMARIDVSQKETRKKLDQLDAKVGTIRQDVFRTARNPIRGTKLSVNGLKVLGGNDD